MSERSDTWDIPAWAAATTPSTGPYPTVRGRAITHRLITYTPPGEVVYPKPVKVDLGFLRPQVTAGCVARVQGSFLLLAWLGIALLLSWLFGG